MASQREVEKFAEHLQYVFDLGDFKVTNEGGGVYEMYFYDSWQNTRSLGFESELKYNCDSYGFELRYYDEQGNDYYIAVK